MYVCVSVRKCPMWGCPQKLERALSSFGARVPGGYEPPYGCWEPNTDPLQEQQVFLAILTLNYIFPAPAIRALLWAYKVTLPVDDMCDVFNFKEVTYVRKSVSKVCNLTVMLRTMKLWDLGSLLSPGHIPHLSWKREMKWPRKSQRSHPMGLALP